MGSNPKHWMDVSKASHYIYYKNVKSPNLDLKQGISYLKREGEGEKREKQREREREREIDRDREREKGKEGES